MADASTKPLLSFIRGAETSRGYKDYYRGSKIAPPKDPTTMTVREIQEWQKASINAGSKSSAVGGYQFISGTLNGLVSELGLTGNEVFDGALQDRMGEQLLKRRGLDKWKAGQLPDELFMDNLAMEWASLPRATGKKRGRSHYAGDGLNGNTRGLDAVTTALSASRNGEDVDLSGLNPSDQNFVATARMMSEGDKQARMASADPAASYTGADFETISQAQISPFTTDREITDAEAQAEAETPTTWEGFKTAIDEQWVSQSVLRQLGKESFIGPDDYQMSDDVFKEVKQGLPEDYLSVFEESVSDEHARVIAENARKSYEADQKMAKLGWKGIGLNIGAAMLDPVAIGLSAATEGVAAPFIYGAKIGRLGRAVRAGALAAGTNVALDSYLISQDPVGKWEDLVYSAAGGFILGSAAGALRRSPVDHDLARTAAAFIKEQDTKAAGKVAVQGANDGSVGAARVDGLPLRDLTTAERAAEAAEVAAPASIATGKLDNIRIDIMGKLLKSENPILRRVAGLLDENALGNADGSVSIYSAYEKRMRIERGFKARFNKDHAEGFKAWAKDSGKRGMAIYDPAVRAEFNTLVGKAVARPLDAASNPHVNKVASRFKAEMAEALKFGKEHNIRGFNGLSESDTYIARQHNIQRIDELATTRQGDLHALVARAFMSGEMKFRNANPGKWAGKPELDYENDALPMAKAYIKSIRSRKYQGMDIQHALTGDNTDVLKNMLDDVGVSPEDIVRITDGIRLKVDGDAGRIGNAKRRIILDEEYVDDKLGLSIEDLLDRDVENVFNSYIGSVAAEGAIEEAFSRLKVPAANGDVSLHAPSFATVKRWIEETGKVTQDELDKLETLYNAVKGIPQEPEKAWKAGLKRIRAFNFVRVMGQVGVAQVSEFGNILGNGGLKSFAQHAPSFTALINAARTGKLNDQFMDEVEAIWSNANDVLQHNHHVRVDGEIGVPSFAMREGKSTKMQKFDYGLSQAQQATSLVSGMTHVNMMLKRMNGRVLVQRFLDHAHGDRKINMKRFKALGIDEAMADKISAQIKSHMKYREGIIGKKVTHINIDQWDDIDAKNAFINGIDRWARRSIQENNPGAMPAFMTKELGKTVGQFRSFMLGAYTKQLLSGLRHNDWEAYSAFMASMVFGGIAYVGQTQLNSIGRSDRDEWLDEKLSMASIAKASFQRAGFSTFMPAIADAVAWPLVDKPIFAFRTTDLSTGIFGNPSVDLMDTSLRAIGGTLKALVNEDYDFSQQDFRAITSIAPWQNAFGIRNVLAAVTGSLPKYSQ